MKILVLGANGRIGNIIVEKSLQRGHEVTAFVHAGSRHDPHDNLTILQGDVHNQQDLIDAMDDIDVVVSALGSWGTSSKDVLSTAMNNLIPIMKNKGVSRIVSLTGADARDEVDALGALHRVMRPLLMLVARKVLRDGERHLQALRKSNIDWTVVRSPVMNDNSSKGYELIYTRPRPWKTIGRENVAEAMLDVLENNTHIRSAPFIYRS